ncbi:HMG-box domain-containing protein [Aspergillus chevalieri]|uniref:HMG box domain-containing protein n=1 Tax=Aspergillus chevalieri TaxID=182096 RepID=A0A7R7ZSB1_ASPCH|nr:uncharacterized protein ACHE_70469A [Aspergillus chevalieri]BCR91626.1 hypothetical protein ACHE_70469A [Aspergillus chevalieri]
MATVPYTTNPTTKSSDTVTELLWKDALRHLKYTNNEVLLPTNVRDMIGQDNVDKIKSRLSALLGAPVVGFIDESINAFRLMRTPTFSGSAVSVASHDTLVKVPKKGSFGSSTNQREKPPVSSKAAKVPRPPNAFILYRQHHHPKIKEAYPDFQNNDISIMLGKQWKAEPEEVRAHYKALADEQKKKHAEEYPDYQYTPRRPCERKRRASSRQYAKHSKAAAAAGLAAASAKAKSYASTGIGLGLGSIPESGAGTTTRHTPKAESPTSMTSGATLSTVSTPAMQAANGMDHDLSEFNVFFGPSDLQDEQFNFDTVSFDAMVQQLRNDQNQDVFLQPLNPTEQAAVDSFEFSDYIADCF